MSDEATLLPCPWCGCEAETHKTIDGWIAACGSEQSELDGFTHKAQAYGTTEAEAIAAWNARAATTIGKVQVEIEPVLHGTLTAEQVREAIEKRFDFDVWVPLARWQAIADELNELGSSGTCKITATATNNLMYPDYMTKWYELSCGHSLTLKGDEAPKWCAVCGKAVER